MRLCTFVEPPQPCVILYGKPPSLEYCAKCLDVSVESLKKKTCPKCGKPFELVALASDYYIVGCPEHREYDKIYEISP